MKKLENLLLFLDEQNVSEGDRTTSVGLKPSSLPGKTKQKQDLDGLQQGDSKAKRKPRKGITNRSKNGQDDKILDTVAGSSRDLSPRRGTREKQIESVYTIIRRNSCAYQNLYHSLNQ